MSNKVSLKNPKDQNFEVHQSKVVNLLEKAAQRMFKDKAFHEEFKAVFAFTSILKFLSNLASFLTGFVAIQIATKLVFGVYLSAFFAIVISVCLEAVKTFFWRINSKWILKYKKISKLVVGVLVALHLVSLGLSAYGGWILPKLITLEEEPTAQAPNLDSIKAPYTATIAKLDAMLVQTSQKAANTTSNSTVKSINQVTKELLAQKKQQEQLKNTAILDAKAKTAAEQSKLSERYEERQKQHLEDIFLARVSCLMASVFFEFLFVVCSLFGVYYLFRLNIEIEARGNGGDDLPLTATEQPLDTSFLPSTAKHEKAPHFEPIGFHKKGEKDGKNNAERTCQLPSCGSTFISNVHNKKYCSTNCRQMAYLKREQSKIQ